jgi:Uma2 family endonuclease
MALHPKLETAGISMTEAAYLESELTAEVKREYIEGRVYAMTGASNNHSRITLNVASEFRQHLKGSPCEAFMTDIKIKAGQNYFYPDVIVDCSTSGADYFANSPVLIVEVLSKSTQKCDLTTKLIQYINLPTLKEYVLIEQDIVRVLVLRKNNNWQHELYFLGDAVTFEAINLTLTVEEIYDRVENDEMNEFRQKGLS